MEHSGKVRASGKNDVLFTLRVRNVFTRSVMTTFFPNAVSALFGTAHAQE
jgi:hypothetical protein